MASINKFFDSIGSFFSGGDQIPWCDGDIIVDETTLILSLVSSKQPQVLDMRISENENVRCIVILHDLEYPPYQEWNRISGCEREVAEASKDGSDEQKNDSIMRLSWSLVHSKQPEDVQRGIAMLEASLANSTSPLQQREKLYLLAVGYYRSGNYSRSRQLLEQCLEIEPDWRQALVLKKTVEDQIAKDGVIGIGITATAVGLIAGGIAAALARKN